MGISYLGGAYKEGDIHTYTPDVWGWLLIEYDIRSVIDIGCGYGHNAKWFFDQGCDVIGIEGDSIALENNVLPTDCLVRHDYTQGPFVPDRPFDLALCTEFVEHVSREFEPNWLATVEQSKFFLMTFARPGQGGHHHVNEQPDNYWFERLSKINFFPYLDITYNFRKTTARKPTPWGRNTLTFFAKE